MAALDCNVYVLPDNSVTQDYQKSERAWRDEALRNLNRLHTCPMPFFTATVLPASVTNSRGTF